MGQIVIALIGATILVFFGLKNELVFERLIISIFLIIQFAILVLGWGDFKNVHGGFIGMLLLGTIGLILVAGELLLTVIRPSKTRLYQLLIVITWPIILIVLGIVSS